MVVQGQKLESDAKKVLEAAIYSRVMSCTMAVFSWAEALKLPIVEEEEDYPAIPSNRTANLLSTNATAACNCSSDIAGIPQIMAFPSTDTCPSHGLLTMLIVLIVGEVISFLGWLAYLTKKREAAGERDGFGVRLGPVGRTKETENELTA